MDTINYIFKDSHELKAFVIDQGIKDNSRLLIQVFSCLCTYPDIKKLHQIFSTLFPSSCLMGTTTDGAILGEQMAKEQDVIVAFTQFKHTDLTFTHDIAKQSDSFLLGQEVVKKIYDENKTKAIISLTDGIHINGEEYLNGIDSIYPNVPVAGGMAGDNGQVVKTYLFSHSGISDYGAMAVALNSDRLHVKTSYSFNWTPIGKRMVVTKSSKNRVFEIDGLPIIDVYEKYMGKKLACQLPHVGIEFPLVIQADDMQIGRAVLEKLPDGSLMFAGNVLEQSKVRFGVGNVDKILQDSQHHADHLSHDVESIFVYSCMARRRFLGASSSLEFDALNNLSTVSGFFTYGEFYTNAQNKKFLLNESMTVLALSEGVENKEKKVPKKRDKQGGDTKTNALLALSHLVNVVSEELENLNAHLEDRVKDNTSYILQQIYTDRLTHIPNRAKLIKDIDANKENSVILINIDQFSMINDFYGYRAGDAVLKQLSRVISSKMNVSKQSLYRLSADEFVLLYPYDYSIEKLTSIITKCLSHLETFIFKYQNEEIAVSVTIAAAKEKKNLLAHLSTALRYARNNQLNFSIYCEELLMTHQHKANIAMAKKVRSALNDNRIVPFYQPIIELSSGEIVKYECLARLIDDDGSIITPYEFLPIARKIRLYHHITRLMLIKAFKRFSATGIAFTLNLSIDDILDKQIQSFIFDKIEQYTVASQVTFEILETQELKNDQIIVDFIEKIQAMNGEISIDDFGSGFANFERMTRINANVLKIDGSLIKNIHKDANAVIVVETIISFADKLGMQVVAEFVHSQAVLDVVKSLGVSHAQGYFFGKPEASLMRNHIK